MLCKVDDIREGDLVRFTPGQGLKDRVLAVRYRPDSEFPDNPRLAWVTVTHETGCWSKRPGETVELLSRETHSAPPTKR